MLWWRANAQNVSFRNSLQWPIYNVNSVGKAQLFFTIENELLLILFRSHEKDGYNAERKNKKYINMLI